MLAWPTAPPASVTFAVIVWRPERRFEVTTDAPVPSGPSRLDVHWMRLETSPLSASTAAPVRVTGEPGMTREPLAGARMRTSGAWSCVSVRTSCGWPLDASRDAYVQTADAVDVRPKLTVPSPVTALVTSSDTTWFAATEPCVATVGPSIVGRVL